MPRKPALDHLGVLVAPAARLVWGLALIAVLSLSTSWPVRGLLTLAGYVLARLAGKKISLGYFGFLVFTVALFHLFLPFGKVFFSLGGFPLTEGALLEGLGKGVTLCGLVFLSLAAVSRKLVFPGRWGRLWARTFAYYEQLLEVRKNLDPRSLFSSLDTVLEQIYPTASVAPQQNPIQGQESPKPRTRPLGWLLVFVSTASFAFLAVWLK